MHPSKLALDSKSDRCSFSTPIADRRSPDILWSEIECVHPAGIPTRRPSRKRERMLGGKKVRLWKDKKKRAANETSRCRRMACYDRVLFLGYESYQKSYQKPFSPAGRSPQAWSLPTLSANGYLWMHQSTPPLPGFNAIRIDYIDFARGHNLRSSL